MVKNIEETIANLRRAQSLLPSLEEVESLYNEAKEQGNKERINKLEKTRSKVIEAKSLEYKIIAVDHVDHGRIAEAEALFQKAIDLGQEDYHMHFKLAEAYEEKGDVKKALSEYERALSFEPEIDTIHIKIGTCYFQLAEFWKAAYHFEKAEEINPNDIGNVTLLALFYDKMDVHTDRAVRLYERAITLGDEEAKARLADLKERKGNELNSP